jgi:hypothetical protein
MRTRGSSSTLRRSCSLSLLLGAAGCSGTSPNGFGVGGDGGLFGVDATASADGNVMLSNGNDSGHLGSGTGGGGNDGSVVVSSCPSGKTTSVTGTVYDPANKNPLYNVEVYIPAGPLAALPKGVPTGPDSCSCSALFPSAAYASTSTKVDGTFQLDNVPTGTQKLVVQIGKWRHAVQINVSNECGANAIPDHTLALPGTVAAGNTDDSMPDIAVSTGSADSLECLMLRVGVAAAEYVPGTSTAGHVHVFNGGDTGGGGGHSGNSGKAESNPMTGAPASPTSLWANQGQLMPFDILLLSCEGGETYNANPQALEDYLNAGGRAFGSHYHYSWFSGPNLPNGSGQTYLSALPADYGANGSTLGTWTADGNGGGGGGAGDIAGAFDTSLNPGPGVFTKGQTLESWLAQNPVSALGQGGVSSSQLPIYQPRYNVVVGPSNPHSQPWLTSATGTTGQTMYFSFDTPLAGVAGDGGALKYCGRAVFSDMHVGGDTTVDNDTVNSGAFGLGGSPPPAGCDNTDLSPQEKALEFMLFDLSSCVTDDSKPIPDAGTVMIPIPK